MMATPFAQFWIWRIEYWFALAAFNVGFGLLLHQFRPEPWIMPLFIGFGALFVARACWAIVKRKRNV
jgi:hypothetical protein